MTKEESYDKGYADGMRAYAYHIELCKEEQEPILDKIRAEIETIEISGMVDANTMYVRSAGQIKNIVIEIIDKYREQKPKTDTWSIKEVTDALERHGLLEQEPKTDVLEQIRAEMQELIDWHDCPIEYDNGNDYWYCQAVNQCISKLDKVLKEQTT